MSSGLTENAPQSLEQALLRVDQLIAAGAWAEAEGLVGEIWVQGQADPALISRRAMICAGQRQFGAALKFLFEGAASHPDHPSLLFQLASGLANAGLWDEAIERLDQALVIAPDWPLALMLRGSAHLDAGRPKKARSDFARVLARDQDHVKARQGWLACQNARTGRSRESVALLGRRAQVLLGLGRPAEALTQLDAALRQIRTDPSLHNNRGLALFELDQPEAALASFESALELIAPDDPVAAGPLLNRGRALVELGRPLDAARDFDRALALRPGDPGILFNQSLARFLSGHWAEAWQGFEQRWSLPEMAGERRAAGVRWDGAPNLAGRRLLITVEQGFGDTLQFCRYATLAKRLGATVMLESQPALIPLLQSLEGVDSFVVRGAAYPDHDLQCPMLSLPGLFGTTSETDTATTPYLSAPVSIAARWRDRLHTEAGPNIGLAWSGNPAHPKDRHRSMAAEALSPLFAAAPTARFHSLQPGLARSARQALPELVFHPDEELDFCGTAGLMEALDLVISVDTSMAHLAGALGRPVWILLPFAPDWRWASMGDLTPWYPTARLFRQPMRGDWSSAVQAVAAALTAENIGA